MGLLMSLLVVGSQEHYLQSALEYDGEGDEDVWEYAERQQGNKTPGMSEDGESLFDKLYMYPIFACDRRLEKKLNSKKTIPLVPIIMHGNRPDRDPVVFDLSTILKNLDSTGELSKRSSFLTSLLVAQFDEGSILVNYAFGYSNTTGKCYFYKEGNFESVLLGNVPVDENLNETNVPSRKAFLSYLHQLMNTLSGSIWLNGFCVHGPENPSERIQVDSIKVRSIPARVTIKVHDLSGVHCIRTKNRLEIYAKANNSSGGGQQTKSIWFRGEYANSLVVTEVENQLMSILIPPYTQEENDAEAMLRQ